MYISAPIPKEEIILVKKKSLSKRILSIKITFIGLYLLLSELWIRYFEKLVSSFKISEDERKHTCYCIAVCTKRKGELQNHSKLRINKT